MKKGYSISIDQKKMEQFKMTVILLKKGNYSEVIEDLINTYNILNKVELNEVIKNNYLKNNEE